MNLRSMYLPAVFLAALGLAATHGPSRRASAAAPRSALATPLPDLHGTWVGTWSDTKYFVSDTLGFFVTINSSDVQGNGTIGMQPFALPDEAGTLTGTIDVDTLDFGFSSTTISGTGRIVGGDIIDGVGTVGGLLGYGGFTFTGTTSDAHMLVNFIFDSPSGGEGVIRLTNVVPVHTISWGTLKADYAGPGR